MAFQSGVIVQCFSITQKAYHWLLDENLLSNSDIEVYSAPSNWWLSNIFDFGDLYFYGGLGPGHAKYL